MADGSPAMGNNTSVPVCGVRYDRASQRKVREVRAFQSAIYSLNRDLTSAKASAVPRLEVSPGHVSCTIIRRLQTIPLD